jgi:hypothetical protein
MTYVVIGFLVLASFFLGKAWIDARSENSGLRQQVATLKRKLAKHRGA